MESSKDIPRLLYEEFSRYCGKEKDRKIRILNWSALYRIRRISKSKTPFPGSEGIAIGLSKKVMFTEDNGYFSIWIGGCRNTMGIDEHPILSVIFSSTKLYSNKYVDSVNIHVPGESLMLCWASAPFIAEVVSKTAGWISKIQKGSS